MVRQVVGPGEAQVLPPVCRVVGCWAGQDVDGGGSGLMRQRLGGRAGPGVQ